MTRGTAFDPGLITVRSLLQVCEKLLVHKTLTSLRDDGFHELPNAEELAVDLKEQVLVEQAIIQQCAGLLPVVAYHHCERAIFRSWTRDAHGVVEIIDHVVLEKPIARLAQLRLATQFID